MSPSNNRRVADPHGFSVAILAGGRSARMRSDKAFVSYRGTSFISRIAGEASRVCKEVLVVIGDKARGRFEAELGLEVKVVNDAYNLGAPLGGMLTAFDILGDGYAAVIGCDTPLVKGELLQSLHDLAVPHSAAVPRWESGKIEPLCSVYEVREARRACGRAMESGRLRCRDMIALLEDVNYVPVSQLRASDPALESFVNVNTPDDLEGLRRTPWTGRGTFSPLAGSQADE